MALLYKVAYCFGLSHQSAGREGKCQGFCNIILMPLKIKSTSKKYCKIRRALP
jgi:hypothetical protein